jgi:sugar lactone lactonase YvrE/mono/diheme cytochrome c family protein
MSRRQDRAAPLRALVAIALAALVLAAGEEGGRTVWGGVYTDAQAERGALAYQANCQSCHGAQLGGQGEAKPLTGAAFLSNWNGLSVGDLFERVRTTMPMNAPKSLPRGAYADILAYVLKFNGFPAGAGELPGRAEMLADIRFDAFRSSSLGVAGAWAAAPSAEVAPNSQPNPYVADPSFLKMPAGRTMGSSSAVAVDSRGHIWVADRCGANDCAKSDLDPILEFDAQGHFVKAFGRGLFVFPHGLLIDSRDHIWVTDAFSAPGKGAQVFEFDRDGHVLRTLGKAGVSAAGRDTFAEPCAVAVARDGTIYVADGHTEGRDPARIVKFDSAGRYIKEWGSRGPGPGQLEVPHSLALDSRGRLFVGDRWNNRIEIFDPDGKLLGVWTQFGRPSGVYIDAHDTLYVTDSESRERQGYGHHPGWKRGIRIGSARTGAVTTFIPDPEPNPEKLATSGGEGVWADPHGVVYAAEVTEQAVVRYVRKTSLRVR